MKKSILGLLSAFTLSIVLISCSKDEVTQVETNQDTTEVAPTLIGEGARQTITAAQLSGKYKLRYTNTAQNRTWVATTTVGLQFIPDSFLYSTGNLDFNPRTLKVALSSISSIPTLPDVNFGSYTFQVSGENLKILSTSTNNGEFKVTYLKSPWLILEDNRTKIRWAFYKK
jgi:hypothetical protein